VDDPILRDFGSLKALYMDYGLVGQLSRFQQLDEGGSPTDLLPELRELWYWHSTTDDSDDAFFAEFVHARRPQAAPLPYFAL
jgi:hypothetical protein